MNIAGDIVARRLVILLSCVAILAASGISYMVWRGDRCASLFRVARHVERLEARRARPDLTDHLVGLLHNERPLAYYKTKFENEKKALLASGQLVELRIPYTAYGPRSDREIAMVLLSVHQQTGTDFWFDFDLTNRLMLVWCKACDLPRLSAALK